MIEYDLWENKILLPKYIYKNKILNIAGLFISALMKISLISTAKLTVAWSLPVSNNIEIDVLLSSIVHLLQSKILILSLSLFYSPDVFIFLEYSAY